MSWVRVDDGWADTPEMIAAGPTAIALALWALCYSSRHLTDGHIPRAALLGCSLVADKSQRSRSCGRLEVAEFWAKTDDGYQILRPFDFLQKAADVKEKRAANAERQARWREKQQARRNGARNALRNAPPDPTPMTPTVSLRVGDAALRAEGAPLAPPCHRCGGELDDERALLPSGAYICGRCDQRICIDCGNHVRADEAGWSNGDGYLCDDCYESRPGPGGPSWNA